MHYPKISIVTPSFNSVKYIEFCIQSILVQDYKNFEHIIIDGNSTDGTIEILKKYPHLKWISEPDKGQSDALNKGFNIASGEWVLWLNSDDLLTKEALHIYVKYINKKPCMNFFYGHVNFINEYNQKIRTVFQIPYSYRLTIFRLYIPPSTGSIFHKSILHTHKLENNFHYIMDVVWFIQNGKHVKGKLINAVLSEFRISKDNKTAMQIVTGQRPKRHIEELVLSLKFYPFYAQNIRSLLYLTLRVVFKVEYYFKKLFMIAINKIGI